MEASKTFCQCGCGTEINPLINPSRVKLFVPGHNSRLRAKKVINFVCPQCNIEFSRFPEQITRKADRRFCSIKCSTKFYYKKFLSHRVEKSRKEGSKKEFECATCKNKFTEYVSRHPKSLVHYCSQLCFWNRTPTQSERNNKSKATIERMKKHTPFLYSKPHRKFVDMFYEKFCVKLDKEFRLVTHDGKAKFYDCKIPSFKILFEIDGDYWHTRKGSAENDLLKTNLASENGYLLFRVPENDVEDFINKFDYKKIIIEYYGNYHEAI